jgi:RNA polymerase sigma factor (sigma-70 family)
MSAAPAVLLKRLTVAASSDGDCLRQYARTRDEAAFAELVRRNGPLVLRACRSVLSDPAAAEDAFQATFLTLARNAGRLAGSVRVAGWLYRVAVRSAGAIRRAETRRRRHEQVAAASTADLEGVSWAEVRATIDEEIARLPEQYRSAVLLCYVQGLTYDAAAARLGCPLGALRGRLERGRAMLRRRLERLGLPTVALFAAGVPLVSTELRAATVAAIRTVGRSGSVRLLIGAIAGCVLAVSVGVGLVAVGDTPADPAKPPTDPPTAAAPASAKPAVDAQGDPLPAGAIARLGSTRFRHGSNIDRVIVSADGKRIVSRADSSYRLWDGTTGRAIPLCDDLAHPSHLARFIFAPAGNDLVAIVDEKDHFRVLNPETGKEVFRAARTAEWVSVGITPDGKTLLAVKTDYSAPGGARARLRAWDVAKETWTEVGDFPTGGNETRLHFSADSKIVAIKFQVGGMGIWDLSTGKKVALQIHNANKGFMEAAALSPDGKFFACEDWSAGTVHVYDVASDKELPRLPNQPKQFGQTLAFSQDGKTLAAVESPIHIRLWDVTTGKKLRDIQAQDYQVRDLAFADGGKRLVAADGNGVTVFDPATGKALVDYGGHTYAVSAAAWSPDGKRIVSGAAYTDNIGRVWDAVTGAKRFDLRGHQYGIEATDFCPDGRLIATGSQDTTAKLWDAETGKELHTFAAKDGMVYGLTFSPDGRFLVTGGRKSVHVWDVAGRKEVRTLPHVGGLVLNVKFATDGRSLVVQDRDSGIHLVDFATGKELVRYTTSENKSQALAVSADGRRVATVRDDGSIVLRDAATAREVRELTGPRAGKKSDTRVVGVAFSPDGRALAATLDDGQVRVYELVSGMERFRFNGHVNCALHVAFSPDGSRLLSTSSDRTLVVWDVTGRRLAPAPAPKDLVAAWTDLANADAARGFAAICYLVDHPDQCIASLKDRIQLAAPPDAKAVAALIEKLGSPRFADRERASKELAALGEAVAGPLRDAEKATTSAEVRERLGPLLAALSESKPTGDRLRAVRAIEALERIGTAEARQVLTTLADGAAEANLTRDAKAALQRLR